MRFVPFKCPAIYIWSEKQNTVSDTRAHTHSYKNVFHFGWKWNSNCTFNDGGLADVIIMRFIIMYWIIQNIEIIIEWPLHMNEITKELNIQPSSIFVPIRRVSFSNIISFCCASTLTHSRSLFPFLRLTLAFYLRSFFLLTFVMLHHTSRKT